MTQTCPNVTLIITTVHFLINESGEIYLYPGGLWSIVTDEIIEDDEATDNTDHILDDTDDVVKRDEGIPQVKLYSPFWRCLQIC